MARIRINRSILSTSFAFVVALAGFGGTAFGADTKIGGQTATPLEGAECGWFTERPIECQEACGLCGWTKYDVCVEKSRCIKPGDKKPSSAGGKGNGGGKGKKNCPSGQILWQDECIDKCPEGQHYNDQRVCIMDECKAGQEPFAGKCVDKCADGYTRNQESGKCTDCTDGFEKLGGLCVAKCIGEHKSRNMQTGQCECTDGFEKDSDGQCVCPEGSDVIGGVCVAKCTSACGIRAINAVDTNTQAVAREGEATRNMIKAQGEAQIAALGALGEKLDKLAPAPTPEPDSDDDDDSSFFAGVGDFIAAYWGRLLALLAFILALTALIVKRKEILVRIKREKPEEVETTA